VQKVQNCVRGEVFILRIN